MRYVSSEEARSDLFLSAAVYLIGPLVVELLLELVPLRRIPGVAAVLAIALPLVYTVLVPYLLIRYRKESVRDYLPRSGHQAFAFGLLLALPIVVATLLATLLDGIPFQEAVPVLLADEPVGALLIAQRLASWLGVAALAIYATGKARDAFRSDPKTVRAAALEIARVLGIVVSVTALVLLLANQASVTRLLLPLGIASAVAIAYSRPRGPSSTSRAVLLTPTLILALPAFTLSPVGFLQGLYFGALLAGIGLVIGMLEESRRPTYGALAIALVIALVSPILPITQEPGIARAAPTRAV
ncbi:MAG: hypothetical protein ACRDYA_21245 [Egibacteraceae bacterium]